MPPGLPAPPPPDKALPTSLVVCLQPHHTVLHTHVSLHTNTLWDVTPALLYCMDPPTAELGSHVAHESHLWVLVHKVCASLGSE